MLSKIVVRIHILRNVVESKVINGIRIQHLLYLILTKLMCNMVEKLYFSNSYLSRGYGFKPSSCQFPCLVGNLPTKISGTWGLIELLYLSGDACGSSLCSNL